MNYKMLNMRDEIALLFAANEESENEEKNEKPRSEKQELLAPEHIRIDEKEQQH